MKTPHPFQMDVISRARGVNVLNADECGLGKTLTAVVVGRFWLQENPGGGAVLVVCPKRLKAQWEEVLLEEGGGFPVKVVENGVSVPNHGWVVVHYEYLVKAVKAFATMKWGYVICDEAHYIKNRQAARTKAVKQLKPLHKMALTATPMGSNPGDLWSILNWLYPTKFTSFWKFFEEYVEYEKNAWQKYPIIKGTKNAEQLARHMAPFTFQRTKREVAPDLPPRIDEDVVVELEPTQLQLYRRIKKEKDIEIDLTGFKRTGQVDVPLMQSALVKMIRLMQVTSDPRLIGAQVPSAKIEWIKEWLENNPNETVVIFSRFRGTAELLSRELKTALCMGGVQPAQWEPFLKGKNRILCGTIAGMAEGLNLQIASTAIFIDMEWSPITMKQAIDRIHRIDIKAPKYIINLFAKGTIDRLVAKSVRENWTDVERVRQFLLAHEQV